MIHVKFLALGLIALVMQATMMDSLSVLGGRPDMLLVLALFACTLIPEADRALLVCWILGLLKDLGTQSVLGGYALLFLAAGYLAVAVRSLFYRNDFVGQFVVAAGVCGLLQFMYALGVVLFGGTLTWGLIFGRVLMISLYTASIAPLIFAGLYKLKWHV